MMELLSLFDEPGAEWELAEGIVFGLGMLWDPLGKTEKYHWGEGYLAFPPCFIHNTYSKLWITDRKWMHGFCMWFGPLCDSPVFPEVLPPGQLFILFSIINFSLSLHVPCIVWIWVQTPPRPWPNFCKDIGQIAVISIIIIYLPAWLKLDKTIQNGS